MRERKETDRQTDRGRETDREKGREKREHEYIERIFGLRLPTTARQAIHTIKSKKVTLATISDKAWWVTIMYVVKPFLTKW